MILAALLETMIMKYSNKAVTCKLKLHLVICSMYTEHNNIVSDNMKLKTMVLPHN